VQQKVREFIAMFVRPEGVNSSATSLFVEAVESAITLKPQTWTTPLYAPLLRAAIWPLAFVVRRQVLARLNRGIAGGTEAIGSLVLAEGEFAARQLTADGSEARLSLQDPTKMRRAI